MDLSEDKAKEILDFLAKKAGYCKLSIKCKRNYALNYAFNYDKSKQFVIACKAKLELDDTAHDVDYLLYAAKNLCPNVLTIFLRSMSYVNALKTMLEMSKNGKDIFFKEYLQYYK